MKILIIGEEINFNEASLKFGDQHQYTLAEDHKAGEKLLGKHDLVFDFIIDEEPYAIEMYVEKSLTVFINAAKISLGDLSHSVENTMDCTLFGFNGLPTLLNRNILEVTLRNDGDSVRLKEVCDNLKTDFVVVDDRVGLVTPRVICMIINEAYYTVQEGTASRADIDIAMKLGTNYPFGPFEWCSRIGIRHVYELLEAVYEDTRDERYKICSLMKKEYFKSNR